jgi:hypothetical protein
MGGLAMRLIDQLVTIIEAEEAAEKGTTTNG